MGRIADAVTAETANVAYTIPSTAYQAPFKADRDELPRWLFSDLLGLPFGGLLFDLGLYVDRSLL